MLKSGFAESLEPRLYVGLAIETVGYTPDDESRIKWRETGGDGGGAVNAETGSFPPARFIGDASEKPT